MQNIHKITLREDKQFLYLSICAGIAIGFGGLISLSLPNTYLSAMAFSIGIYIVMLFDMKLFTGVVPKLFTENWNKQNIYKMFMCLCGNGIGVLSVALFARESNFCLVDKALKITSNKINLIVALLGGIFCGIVIGLIVLNKNPIMKWILTTPLIMLFILTKMEHCVANMFYMAVANDFRYTYLLLSIVGNIIGGYLIGKMVRIVK